MQFTVIGSGTAVPSKERGAPCCHLNLSGEEIVFDLGSGSVRQLWRRDCDVRRLSVLALSHFHLDHTADLAPLLFALRNPEFGRPGSLTVVGPPGLADYLAALEGLYGDWIRPPGLTLEVREMAGEPLDFSAWRLRSAPTGHTAESLAYRVEEKGGKAVVYGGDSPYSESLIDLAGGADLLVLECSFPDHHRKAEGHLTPSTAARMAAQAGVTRLLLTHFYPAADDADLLTPAGAYFSGDIVLAFDGLSLAV